MSWFATSWNLAPDALMKENDLKQTHFASFHSDEVQDIMGRRPSWILRWGVTVIIAILVGVMIAFWFIKSPQTVMASVTLTSDNPPSDLVAKTTGILDSVYVVSGDTVWQGQLLTLIASAARYEDIVKAEHMLQIEAPVCEGSALHLGDIQHNWIDYCSVVSDYADYLKIDQIGKKKELLAGQLWRAKEYYRRLEQQRKILVEELSYERRTLERDSILFHSHTIAEAEYEATQKTFISKKNILASFDATMANAHLSHLQLEQQILELDTQFSVESSEYERRIAQARSSLQGQIALWKEQYAIIAPYDGVASLQNVWGRGQRVSAGDIIASVAPIGGMIVIGRLKVPSSSFGKVQVGQEVNIKLNGFPYLEFGILKGEVQAIAPVPENTQVGLTYTVDAALTNGLESTYHKTFPFVQNMDGEAEIITEPMRLIEQFIRPIRDLFVNR